MTESIYKYKKHLLAVDCIIFGYENNKLKLLLSQRAFEPGKGQWSLLGGWIKENETAEKAAERVLHQITGLKDIYLEQVQVFSDPKRDTGGRVVSIAFYALIRIDKHDRELVNERGAKWYTFRKHPKLIFDHEEMVNIAHQKLKNRASHELCAQNLIPSKFTIPQLRALYEAIFQREIDPGNFRKKVLSLKVLEKLNDKNRTESKKGAFYYRLNIKRETVIKERIVRFQ
ncbi:NUDIX domain-containing protein [Bacteroidota bacterium]